jgi:hypothetical protein
MKDGGDDEEELGILIGFVASLFVAFEGEALVVLERGIVHKFITSCLNMVQS